MHLNFGHLHLRELATTMPPRIASSVVADARATSAIDMIHAMSSLSIGSRLPSTLRIAISTFLVPRLQTRNASILSNLSDNPSSYSLRKRKGRGPSSGMGKTSGRGHKGQKQHGKVPARFQGGQTPLWISQHQRGFDNQYVVLLSVLN